MADEQIIYLSPEEELTNVRERLERIPTRRIILVIPLQTQLRSHVGWRLLHSRARELSKDVLVISADRQIRSVAKAAGFKVADSLESPPTSTGKTRPGTRPSRIGVGGRTSPHLRTPLSKISSSQRSDTLRDRPPNPPIQEYSPISEMPTIEFETDTQKPHENEVTTQEGPSTSSTFEGHKTEFGAEPKYNFRIEDAPSLHPLGAEPEDEEPDLFLEDFRRAQSIREAAQPPDHDDMMLPPVVTPQPSNTLHMPTFSHAPGDPLAYMDDFPPPSLPQQHGSVSIHDIDDGVPDITDYPIDITSEGEIEDQGDMGDFVMHPEAPSASWSTPEQEAEEEEIPESPRVYGVRPRSSRSGRFQPPPPQQDFEYEDELPPAYHASTPMSLVNPSDMLFPPMSNRSSFVRGQEGPKAVDLPQSRLVPPRSNSMQSTETRTRQRTSRSPIGVATSTTTAHPPSSPTPTASQSRRKRDGNIWISIVLVLLVLAIIGTLAYIGPSADVTIFLPAKNFPVQMKLTASAVSKLNAVHQTVPAQPLTFDTSVTGKGHASGSTKVGTVQATGSVTFTNKGSQPIEIPTGTLLSTNSGVHFLTTADESIEPVNSNLPSVPVPVQAQNQGESGNVPTGSIVNITPDGQSKIEQFNPGVSLTPLSVTNTDATSGGGAGSATSVTSNDVSTEKAALNAQLQTQVQDWLKKQMHPGDQPGRPTITTETATTTPAVGAVATDGTFSEMVKAHVSVLVASASNIQAAATTELKDALSKSKQEAGYMLLQNQPVQLTQMKNTSSQDGKSINLSFTALGQIVPKDIDQNVRDVLTGKPLSSLPTDRKFNGVQHYLISNPNGVYKTLDTIITVYPGFFPSVPAWSNRINVHIQTVSTTKKK